MLYSFLHSHTVSAKVLCPFKASEHSISLQGDSEDSASTMSLGHACDEWYLPEVDVAFNLVDLGLDAGLLQQALHSHPRSRIAPLTADPTQTPRMQKCNLTDTANADPTLMYAGL